MSVGAILTLGLGQFGSVNLLPTLGYGAADAPVPVVSGRGLGGDDVPRRLRRSPHRGFDLEEWKRTHQADEDLETTVRATWARIKGDPQAAEERAQAAEVVQSFAPAAPSKREARKPLERRVDWAALARDLDAAARVAQIDHMRLARYEEESDDDDFVAALLMH